MMSNKWYGLKTFLFFDEESNEYCPSHQVKTVKFSSKLHEKRIASGYICPKCERGMLEYENVIIRKDNKWITMDDYLKQGGYA